jgi:hypothetical protein
MHELICRTPESNCRGPSRSSSPYHYGPRFHAGTLQHHAALLLNKQPGVALQLVTRREAP